MLMRRNAPGPTFRKSSVVGSPQHWHCSIGCCHSIAIGAAQRARLSAPLRATAWARTSTESKPKILAKKPGDGRSAMTSIVSFGTTLVRNETLLALIAAVVPVPVVDGGELGRARVAGQLVCAGERGRVGVRLQLAVGAVPRADVKDGRGGADEHDHEHQRDHERLGALGPGVDAALGHSTRSVVSLFSRPDLTTTPIRLIENG